MKYRIFILCFCVLFLLSGCKRSAPDAQSSSAVSSTKPTEAFSDAVALYDADLDPALREKDSPEGETVEVKDIKADSRRYNGIDVSKWQGKIDWKGVKAAGIDFAFIRIGFRGENGKLYKDTYADYNIQQASKAGVLAGVYFFSTAISTAEAKAEAQWVYDSVKYYPISLPVVYDCEGYNNSESRMADLTPTARTDNAIAFLSKIKTLGYSGMFYASKSALINDWDTVRLEKATDIWVASYTATAYPKRTVPDYSGEYSCWQYTNKGVVSGISGDVDLVVSYKRFTEKSPLKSGGVDEVKPPEEDNTYEKVNEQVTAKDIVNLREKPATTAKISGELKAGEYLTRIGVGSNGWSKLKLNGKTVYAVSSYLTTEKNYQKPVASEPEPWDGFDSVKDKVTPKNSVNLRVEPSTNSAVAAEVKNGEILNRIGKNTAKGWSKILYKGQTVYAVSSYLTTDLAYNPNSSSKPADQGTEMLFYSVNEQVTPKDETNLRSKPVGGDGSQVVFTARNGEYFTRTGYSDQGWSRVVYKGKTLYCVTSLLLIK